MICLIQRVNHSEVLIKGKVFSKINTGLLIFLGIEKEDTKEDLDYIIKKTINLRIFPDEQNKMNLSIKDINGEILIVSQFTLCADIRKGRRPSYIKAAEPEKANLLYLEMIKRIQNLNINVKSGKFGENMKVNIVNNGPLTIIINSKDKKNEN